LAIRIPDTWRKSLQKDEIRHRTFVKLWPHPDGLLGEGGLRTMKGHMDFHTFMEEGMLSKEGFNGRDMVII
jgi:hypothetical protein